MLLWDTWQMSVNLVTRRVSHTTRFRTGNHVVTVWHINVQVLSLVSEITMFGWQGVTAGACDKKPVPPLCFSLRDIFSEWKKALCPIIFPTEQLAVCRGYVSGIWWGRKQSADLRQEEEEDFVIGEDRMRCHTQQKVLQADSPPLDEVGVEVVCWQLVPHELCLKKQKKKMVQLRKTPQKTE